jgi:methylornithine synthase
MKIDRQAQNERTAAFLDELAECAGMPPGAVLRLLDSPSPEAAARLFAAARQQREKYFGNRVFLYGFLYISTHCRNSCIFCSYRRDNSHAVRYRKSLSEITAAAGQMADSGVHLIDLAAGEDPRFYQGGEDPFGQVVELVSAVREAAGLPLMASVGVVAENNLQRLADAGADWYACYQESHNRERFRKLRLGQDYDLRLNSKQTAKANGLLVEEGLLCGLGETAADLVHSFDVMAHLDADQVRVMTFVPRKGTPLKDRPAPSPLRELTIIALMRIAFPGLLIPASLDIDGLAGLKQRLDAGANVVTSIVPPGQGLAGVARGAKDIEDGRRTVAGISGILNACGLKAATVAQYRDWIAQRRQLAVSDCTVQAAC